MTVIPLDLGRKGSPTRLEEAAIKIADEILDRAWRPTANHDMLSIELAALCRALDLAGYDTTIIRMTWKSHYDLYRLNGGRAQFREIR